MLFHIIYTINIQFINVESYDSKHCVLATLHRPSGLVLSIGCWLVWELNYYSDKEEDGPPLSNREVGPSINLFFA